MFEEIKEEYRRLLERAKASDALTTTNFYRGVLHGIEDVEKELQLRQQAVEADADKSCRCWKFYKGQNSFSFCPSCGRDLRTT